MFDQSSELAEPKSRPDPVQTRTDLISELLAGMRLYGLHYHRIQVTPPFGIRLGADPDHAQFHFVARGQVYLSSPDGALHSLACGDAVLLPRGGPHALLSDPDISCRCITEFNATAICNAVDDVVACRPDTCDEDKAVVFSGSMVFDLGAMHPLVRLMPEVMRVGTLLERSPEILPILHAMEREARTERAGFAGILTRLADVVSASIVRGWVECGCGDASGWVEALKDPRLGRVLAAIHRDPGRNWTVENLASEMGSSRSVFAERFQAVTGMTPLRYVGELRMRLATQWMARGDLSIDAIAERLGYGSQAAFSRAFKRITGQPPGAVARSRRPTGEDQTAPPARQTGGVAMTA